MPHIPPAHSSRLAAAAIAAVAAIAVGSLLLPHSASDAQASTPPAASPKSGHFVWQGPMPIADEVDWSRIEAAADAGPLAIASY